MRRPSVTIKIWMRKGWSDDRDPMTVIYSDAEGLTCIGLIYNRDAKRLGLPHVSRQDVGLVPSELTIAAGHPEHWGES